MPHTPQYGGRPDGAAVDSEGCYWSAQYEGQRLLRLSPTGEVLAEVATPVPCPTMPCFGGPDLKTLFITTSRQGRSPQELARHPGAGWPTRVMNGASPAVAVAEAAHCARKRARDHQPNQQIPPGRRRHSGARVRFDGAALHRDRTNSATKPLWINNLRACGCLRATELVLLVQMNLKVAWRAVSLVVDSPHATDQ